MKAHAKKWKLTAEEVSILRDIEAGKYKSIVTPEMLKGYQLAASRQLKKDKSITIRVNVADLDGFKAKAAQAGFRYQTYLSSLIHQVATGKIRIVL